MKDSFSWMLEVRRQYADDVRWFALGLAGVGTGLAVAGPSWWQRGVGVAFTALGFGTLRWLKPRPRHRASTAPEIEPE